MYLARYMKNKFEICSPIYSRQYLTNKFETYLVAYLRNMPQDTFWIYFLNIALNTCRIHMEYMLNIWVKHW